MPRTARLVVPGIPHHVTQRGNHKDTVFFQESDYKMYLAWLAKAAGEAGTEIWSYCLMPNHVHHILVPKHEDGLRATMAKLHQRYTNFINKRQGWSGHLWQGRFASVAMDESHLANAARYVALNPVRARLVTRPQDWPWSSVRAHLARADDSVVSVAPLLQRYPDFAGLLAVAEDPAQWTALRKSEISGRPIGLPAWLDELEQRSGRLLCTPKRGRPKKLQ